MTFAKRGVALGCDELGGHCVRQAVIRSAGAHRAFAIAAVIGTDPRVKQTCSQAMTNHLCRGHGDRRSEAAARSRDPAVSAKAPNTLRFDSRT